MRALARQAGTSHSAIHAYEAGTRQPTVDVLERVLEAAGFRAETRLVPARLPDSHRAGRILVDVLDLAEALPTRPAARDVTFPGFPR